LDAEQQITISGGVSLEHSEGELLVQSETAKYFEWVQKLRNKVSWCVCEFCSA
jgi:hypothetical protein